MARPLPFEKRTELPTVRIATKEVRALPSKCHAKLVRPPLPATSGVTGQEFSSKINHELTLFACNSGL
jgi:hypothetical protein